MAVRTLGVILLLVFLGFIGYSNTLNAPFAFDDRPNITENTFFRLVDLDFRGLYDAGFKSPCSNRPVANISFAMNYYFGQYDVKGYHIVNIIIHIINGILIYFFACITLRLVGRDMSSLQAFLVSLLWLVHPVQIQSVTYIVQRMNSMAVMFYMLSLLLFIHGRLTQINAVGASSGLGHLKPRKIPGGSKRAEGSTRVNWRGWVLFAGCFVSWVMALGSKEISATLPLILLLYEWYFFQDASLDWLKRNLKYWLGPIVILAFCVFIYIGGSPFDRILGGYANRDFTLVERVLTQFRVVILYISLLLYPHPSRFNLDYDITTSHSLFDPITTLYSMITIFSLIGFAIFLARKERLLSFCILWFFVNLAVESSIISLEMVFEHRLYLPSIGFFLFLTGAVFRSIPHLSKEEKDAEHLRYHPTVFAFILFIPVVSLLIAATWQRNNVWKDEFTLWTDSVKKSPNKARPHNNLGMAYYEKGMDDEAIAEYEKTLMLDPNYALAHNNLGNAYNRKGMADKAIAEYQEALKLEPGLAETYNNLGNVYLDKGQMDEAINQFRKALSIKPYLAVVRNNLGNAYSMKGMEGEAIAEYKRALKIDPNLAQAHYNLGNAYSRKGMADEAIAEYKRALKIDPNHIGARINLGNVYDKRGLLNEAISGYREVLKIEPDNAVVHFNLGNIYSKKKMADEAIAEYRRALKIDPDLAEAYSNLGNAFSKKGMADEAIAEYKRAIKIDLDLSQAHYNLGNAYRDKGLLDEAIAEYQKTLEINPDNAAVHYRLGNLYKDKGLLDKAIAEYKKALSIKPDLTEALNNLGFVYMMQGEYERALPLMKKKIELQPDIFDAYYNIACIYSLQNEIDDAIIWLEKAVEKGFKDWKILETDKDLDNIRGSSCYKKLMKGRSD